LASIFFIVLKIEFFVKLITRDNLNYKSCLIGKLVLYQFLGQIWLFVGFACFFFTSIKICLNLRQDYSVESVDVPTLSTCLAHYFFSVIFFVWRKQDIL
jgi:hypothetical protein